MFGNRSFLAGLTVALSIGFLRPTIAAIRPSFSLDYSSWNATDVVFVETTPRDGVFLVKEALKGNLHAGDVIGISELRPERGAIPISAYPEEETVFQSNLQNLRIPRQPSGSRMVFFLNRNHDAKTSPVQSIRWKSANAMDDMKGSAVWIEGDRLYCFRQEVNPGPSKLVRCWIYEGNSNNEEMSESMLRRRVDEVVRVRSDFDDAMELADEGARAVQLRNFLLSDVFPAQLAALDELNKCGPAAESSLREMINDPALADYKDALIKAFARAGGKTVGAELTSILEQELAFWERVGPSLHEGWWNDDATSHAPLRQHYANIHAAVIALEGVRYSDALGPSTRLRDFWRSMSQLNDKSGLNELATECDRLIHSLQSN